MTPETNAEEARKDNILKCRDDQEPVVLARHGSDAPEEPMFAIRGPANPSWAKAGEPIGPQQLRSRIEPWLTALCQSEHLSVLLGSGLTQAVYRIATAKPCQGMASGDFGDFKDIVDPAAEQSAKAAGRGIGNIEDQVRVANELLRGLEILGQKDEGSARKAAALRTMMTKVITGFAEDVLRCEQGLHSAGADQQERAFQHLVSFLMSFASRSGTRDRLHVFTTNYDRVIEAGAELAGMHLLDRFVGTVAPIFRSSRLDLDLHYNPPGIRGEPRYLEGVGRFTKLHGSLDWVDRQRNIRRLGVPFGAARLQAFLDPDGKSPDAAARLMIYPNAAKDRETTAYPYVELFRDFAAAACRPNHTLVSFGYGFGDEHINRVIEDMLTIPSTHLVIMSYDDPLGRIMRLYERVGRHPQISLLVGDHVGEFQTLVQHYLPKPSIDRTTFRMAELLRARFGSGQPDRADEAGREHPPAGSS